MTPSRLRDPALSFRVGENAWVIELSAIVFGLLWLFIGFIARKAGGLADEGGIGDRPWLGIIWYEIQSVSMRRAQCQGICSFD